MVDIKLTIKQAVTIVATIDEQKSTLLLFILCHPTIDTITTRI